MNNELHDDSPMPFGQYKGIRMMNVPVGYLHWFWHWSTKDSYPEVRDYISRNLAALKKESEDLIWSQ
jgi:uncharacterized protein (DUF3820 family)